MFLLALLLLRRGRVLRIRRCGFRVSFSCLVHTVGVVMVVSSVRMYSGGTSVFQGWSGVAGSYRKQALVDISPRFSAARDSLEPAPDTRSWAGLESRADETAYMVYAVLVS
jgi:hypothetical protein